MILKNINDLNKIIEKKMQEAISLTHADISKVLQYHIDRYYSDCIPSVYKRTNILKEKSLVKLDIVKTSNGYSCEVGFDDDYLNYRYPDTWVDIPNSSIQNTPATGYDVLNWNNNGGWHGGTVEGDVEIWDDAIAELGGRSGILKLLKQNLQNVGLSIK